ncbi:hypothetical protein B0H21DRAFT_779710 [Amylocystis lapponica]|nr:hypothetical protein B0H21DRAFT_779710 [Amylocystis lapponica]
MATRCSSPCAFCLQCISSAACRRGKIKVLWPAYLTYAYFVDQYADQHTSVQILRGGIQGWLCSRRIHGSIEGRALGREKGFEMWEELGFYEGFALTWQAIHKSGGGNDDRSAHNIKHLLELISQFPRVNPSAGDPSDIDIPKLFRQIRSRYRALCATLGVRPTLRAGATSPGQDENLDSVDDPAGAHAGAAKNVWPVQPADRQRSGEELSF